MEDQQSYEEIIDNDAIASAKMGMQFAVDKQPDAEARLQSLAKQYNLPVDSVRLDQKAIERKSQLDSVDYDSLVKTAPHTNYLLSSANKAAIVHDDITNLGEIENSIKGLRGPEPTVANIATGLFSNLSFAPLHSAIKVAVHDAFNDDSSAEAQVRHNDLMRKSLQEQNVIDSQAPEFETATARGIYSGGASFMQALPATAASIATANPLPMMVSAGLQQGFPAYTKYLNRGATKSQAALGAVGEASAEVAFEALPMGFLVSKFGKVGAGEFLSGLLAREIPSEQATTVVQDAIDTAIANPDKSWDDFIKERPAAAYQTLLATVTQGGITGAISTVARKMYGDEKRSDSAESTALNLEQLHKVVAASKVLQRDPTIIHDFATEVSENGPVQNLYINAETLMQSGVSQKLSELLPSITEENIAEALATGGEIKIPVADYVTHIAGTDLAPELVDMLRVEGEDYTRAEAKDYMTNHASEMQAHVERVMAENQVTDEFKKSTEVVKENIKAQLDQVSHFDSAVNHAYATMVSSFYAVQAAQLGTTAEDLFAKYPLTVNGHNFGGQQYDQEMPKLSDIEAELDKQGISHSINDSPRLAPNGKPSNLNPMQWAQVRTEAFKKWFGDWENDPENASKVVDENGEPNILHQNNEVNRGSFNPSTNTITLLKDADLSTFLHETGHFFLETQFDIAARMTQEVETFGASPGQQSILKDTQALLDWFGVSDLDTWHNLDFEEKRHYHEQFARGFEQYLGEGKAPSLELHALFQRFRSWILNVYKELKNLNVKLSPEVRGVMDRLIASEEQIKLAEQGRSMMPLFESAEQAGMTEKEFAEYQKLGKDATNAAIDVLSSKATSDMQWLSNARAKSLKKMQRQHDELRRNVRSEVRTKVMSQPVYQAWLFLTRKLSKDDKINPSLTLIMLMKAKTAYL